MLLVGRCWAWLGWLGSAGVAGLIIKWRVGHVLVLNLGRGWWYCLPRSTTRHTRPFSVARRDRQVHCVSRGYCGRQDARADSLHTGLQPFTCDEVVAVTRCARAAEAAHIVLRVLSQNSISVLKPIGAASTAHLLLCHSAVVTLARLSDPHRYQLTGDLRANDRRDR